MRTAHLIQKKDLDLEHGDEKRGEDRFSLLDPLHHVVEVGHAKEEGTNNYCLGRGHFDKYLRQRRFENKSKRTFSSPELACSV